jgi:predicted O-methyltransferase YrrM
MFVNETIREMEIQSSTHPTSVNIALGEFLYGFTRTVRPSLIVEIGCYIGFSTLHFAQGIRENGMGKVLSIDLFEAHNGIKNPLVVAEEYLNKSGLKDLVRFVKGDSTAVERDISHEIHENIDILFIDGNHSVKGVIKDFNAYYKHVKIGGYVLLHDIHPSFSGYQNLGPRVLIDLLKRKRVIPKSLELIEMKTTDGYGLAIFRKVKKREVRVNLRPNFVLIKYFLVKKLRGPANISIIMRDFESKSPIQNATLKCHSLKIEKNTDQYGKIEFDFVPPRLYSVDVLAEGYRSIRDYKFKVSACKIYNLEINLSKQGNSHIIVRRIG